jgi:phosphoribosylglycinamide formyltransferase 1
MTANRLAIFASGSGTNAEQIMLHFQNHASIEVALVLSNKPDAFVLERAKKFGVPSKVFTRQQFRETDDVLNWLKENRITHIVLAGFMWLMPENIIKAYPDKIINIHPALLPKFGGKGMFGHHVHEAVKAAGEKETGITVHLVNEKYDEGRILFQAVTSLESTDTPDSIANKVHALEYQHYPGQIEKWIAR